MRKKYKDWKIDLKDCKAHINIISSGKDAFGEYGTAFLNVQLPDGRWITFVSNVGEKIRMDYEEAEKPSV